MRAFVRKKHWPGMSRPDPFLPDGPKKPRTVCGIYLEYRPQELAPTRQEITCRKCHLSVGYGTPPPRGGV